MRRTRRSVGELTQQEEKWWLATMSHADRCHPPNLNPSGRIFARVEWRHVPSSGHCGAFIAPLNNTKPVPQGRSVSRVRFLLMDDASPASRGRAVWAHLACFSCGSSIYMAHPRVLGVMGNPSPVHRQNPFGSEKLKKNVSISTLNSNLYLIKQKYGAHGV